MRSRSRSVCQRRPWPPRQNRKTLAGPSRRRRVLKRRHNGSNAHSQCGRLWGLKMVPLERCSHSRSRWPRGRLMILQAGAICGEPELTTCPPGISRLRSEVLTRPSPENRKTDIPWNGWSNSCSLTSTSTMRGSSSISSKQQQHAVSDQTKLGAQRGCVKPCA